MSSSKVRSGQVYVEIGADPSKFFGALKKINARIAGLGRDLSSIGARLGGAGVGLAAPFVASIAAGTKFQDTLLAIRASTGATAAELDAVRAAAMQMSQALGVGPTQATQGMLELLKAGMSLGNVLGGAGKAAIEFAKVGELDVATAAVVMSDAMNVFGVSAETAANTLSAAADSSSTSIAKMAESFSMVAAVAAQSNQSIGDVSAALAVLANNGIKGSDAGTSLKTMLLRLKAPVDEAEAALAEMGLSVMSFRNADGTMKPMVEIIRTIAEATRGMDAAMRDDIFRRVFGQDAIRAAEVFSQVGVEGFESMTGAMENALPVSQKFQALMSGLSGAGIKIAAAMERLGIAVTESVGAALLSLVPPVMGFINAITGMARANADIVGSIGKVAVIAVVAGGSLTGLGIALRVVSYGFGAILKAATAVASPFMLIGRVAASVGAAFFGTLAKLLLFSSSGVRAVLGFATQSGVALARAAAGFGALSVNAIASAGRLAAAMSVTALGGVLRFTSAGIAAIAQYAARSAALLAVSSAQAGSMAAAQVAATVSVISATVARAAEGNMRAAAIGVQALARLGVAGTTNAMIAGASVAKMAAQGTTGLITLGAAGSTSLARIGSTGIVAGAQAGGALAKASATGAASLSRLSRSGVSGVMAIGATAARASAATAASLARAAAMAISQAGAVSAAWLGGMARMVAASAISGVAMAAGFLAPFAAIGIAIAGAGALAYTFKDQIAAAFSSVGALVSQAADYIGTGFNQAVADGAVVMGDLYSAATKTFGGIYEAVTAGDLSGAMDILWAGLVAGWLRGTEAIMSYVDPWITALQNVFTDLGTNIAILWDQMWTTLATTEIGATIIGVFDNIANTVMATFDWLVASVQKAWIRVQGFISGAKDTEERINKIDNENAMRAEQRAQSRPGIEGRQRAAREQGDQMRAEADQRQGAMAAGAEQTKADREKENQRRADERRAATMAAEQNLDAKTRAGRENRVQREQAAELGQNIGAAQSMDELHDLAAQLHALRAAGRLTEEEFLRMQEQLGIKQDEIAGNESEQRANERAAEQKATDGAEAAGRDAMKSKGEVAGTFSAVAAAGMGFGSTLQERIAKASEETAKNTRGMGKPKVTE